MKRRPNRPHITPRALRLTALLADAVYYSRRAALAAARSHA